ncbi:MAG: DUF2214 family protein [Bacteroidales bacterium]|nr:DUF2214 family protein [Bacteroidales bacterium]MCB9013759.1 DUF2214 family protein [Bacteroidales bacterium]
MWTYSIVTYLHFIAIFMVFSSVISELILISEKMPASALKLIRRVDLVFGISTVVVIITGLLLLISFGKGSNFYLKNPLFHLKLTLFVIIGLLSIFPSVRFFKLRKVKEDVITVPDFKTIHILIWIEVIILIVIPLLAVLMANGIGL